MRRRGDRHIPSKRTLGDTNTITGGCVCSSRASIFAFGSGASGVACFKPQAVSKWGGRAELGQTLRASCHIPLLGGVLPYSVVRGDGSTLGAFYDGLFWPSILYLWRVFDVTDTVLKVSGFVGRLQTSGCRFLCRRIGWSYRPRRRRSGDCMRRATTTRRAILQTRSV